MKFAKNPRAHWLSLYVFANVFSAIVMLATGELVGDFQGVPVFSSSALLVATTLVVTSYLVVMGPMFRMAFKLKVLPLNFGAGDAKSANALGITILLLQIAFMAFNVINGVNVAGANTTRAEGPFALIWVFLPVDALFFVFYGFYRESKYFYLNLVVWIASNMLRGWSSVFMFMAFFEWCRAVRLNKISVPKATILIVTGIVLYPVISALKWIFRAQVDEAISWNGIMTGLAQNLDMSDLSDLLWQALVHVFGRLQVTSILTEVIRVRDLLQEEFLKGNFTPFWLEGIHGFVYERLAIGQKSVPISVAFTQYGDMPWQSAVLGDMNINVGLVSWFFIAPMLIPFYIMFVFLLAWISVYFVKKMGVTPLAEDMVWFGWLVYLMPPWFPVFITLIQALMIVLVLRIFFSRVWAR